MDFLPSQTIASNSGKPIPKVSRVDRKSAKAAKKAEEDKRIGEAVKAASKPHDFSKRDKYTIVSVGVCEYCGIRKGEKRADGTIARMEADHRVSRKDGGPSTLDNGACSCEQCNNGKRARSVRKLRKAIPQMTVNNDDLVKKLTELVEAKGARKGAK